jgi:RNA polymerase sigma-70 factor (ECF subfamily)
MTSKPAAVEVRPDGEIVTAVLDGDRSAYAQLVRRYERAVRATTWRVLRDRHLADDAAQEAFVAAYESLGKLRDPSAFGAWLLVIARQRALRIAKNRKRHREGEAPAGPTIASYATNGSAGASPSQQIAIDDQSDVVLEAISTLPEHERVVVMLRYFEDHDVQTIAMILNRPIGTITKQLSRAHERLRLRLRGEESR